MPGFWITPADREIGPPVFEFGHAGAGGSVHGALQEFGVGFSYAMNQMRDDDLDPRALNLLTTLHQVLASAT